MEIFNFLKNDIILITPNAVKFKILKNINKIYNIKFMTINEIRKKLTYDYDEKAIYNLMNKFNINYDIALVYLKNLLFTNKLSSEKNYLHDEKLIIKDESFKNFLNTKEIYVYGYDYISKYDRMLLNSYNVTYIEKDTKTFDHLIYEFNTIEEEITYVAEDISKNINNINNIYLANVQKEYYPVIKRIFNFYNIPINLNENKTLYQTHIGLYFIKNIESSKNNSLEKLLTKFKKTRENEEIFNKIINILNKLYFEEDLLKLKEIIVKEFKKTIINNRKLENAVNEINLEDNVITTEKIYLIGFNQNSIPVLKKDEDFISDKEKSLYLETTEETNKINKKKWLKIISNINDLVITYKLNTPFQTFYPSNIIQEYKLKVIKKTIEISKYSNKMNHILLAQKLDDYNNYNIKSNYLYDLYNNYQTKYKTYNNNYKEISKKIFNKYYNTFNLSYSTIDNYYKCGFKYYLSSVLKIDSFENTLSQYIGNIFHYILSICFEKGFNIDVEYQKYIEKNITNLKYSEQYFLNNLKKELIFVIDTIKKQYTLMNFNKVYYEQKIEIKLEENIIFKGFLDKILENDEGVAIIDYKTGSVNVNLNNAYYGLSMQLPVYLYLIKHFNDKKIIGFYLQHILNTIPRQKKGKTLEEQKCSSLKLEGYSSINEELLEKFDITYKDSSVVKGLKKKKEGFYSYSKVLTDNQINNLYKLTEEKIKDALENIKNANFKINPKIINNKNLSCEYCKYKDICFKSPHNDVYLEEKNLEFLGGDTNELD